MEKHTPSSCLVRRNSNKKQDGFTLEKMAHDQASSHEGSNLYMNLGETSKNWLMQLNGKKL